MSSNNNSVRKKTIGNPEKIKPYRWKKGQSGNPSGRPRHAVSLLSAAFREKLKAVDPATRRTCAEIIAEGLVTWAIGRIVHKKVSKDILVLIRDIADRVEGKPKQQIDVKAWFEGIDERSDDDLRFFLQNRRWPEEMAQTSVGSA